MIQIMSKWVQFKFIPFFFLVIFNNRFEIGIIRVERNVVSWFPWDLFSLVIYIVPDSIVIIPDQILIDNGYKPTKRRLEILLQIFGFRFLWKKEIGNAV